MGETQESVVDTFIENVLAKMYKRPKDYSDEVAELFVKDLKKLFLDQLPKSITAPQALDLCERTRLKLRATYKFRQWPSVKEILDALESVNQSSARSDTRANIIDWPHQNSDYILTEITVILESREEWPINQIEKSQHHVARELTKSGCFSLDELISFGYRPLDWNPNPFKDCAEQFTSGSSLAALTNCPCV